MEEATEQELTWEPFVGRGVLGGVMGMLLVATIAMVFVLTGYITVNLTETVVILGVFVLVGGSLYGVGIGYIIYRIAKQKTSQPNALMRIVIGTGVALGFGLFTKLANPQTLHPIFEIGYALAVGGAAGLMSRQNFSNTVSQSTTSP